MSAPMELSHGLAGYDVLAWSEDYSLAVATVKCVYLVTLKCDPTDLNNSFVFAKSSLPVPAQPLEFDVGLDRNIILKHNLGNPSKFLQSLKLDRTLSPEFAASPSYNAYKTVKWSPAGCDQCGRCILACLTKDHRLSVYRISSKTNKLVKFVELSSLLYEYLKNSGYRFHQDEEQVEVDKEDVKEVFSELKRRIYMLAAMEMHWSGIFTSTIHSKDSDSPPDPKMSRLESDGAVQYILLAVVMKSSDVVIWKVTLPVIESTSENPKILGFLSTGYSGVSSLAWYRPHQSNSRYGWLALGDKEGTIGIWKVDSSENDEPISKQCLEVWTEKDLITVEQLCWGHTKPVNTQGSKPLLFAAKGTYVMVFMLDMAEEDVSLVYKTHICGHHAVSITGLCVKGNMAISCSTDGCVQKAIITETDTGLTVDIELLDPPKPSQLRQSGLGISAGSTYLALVTEICRMAKSGDRSTKIFIKPLRSDAEAEAHLIHNDGPLCTKLDSIEFFRQNMVATYTFPKGLDDLAGDQFWKNEELKNCPYKLKLRRYLLKMKLASVQLTVSQKSRGRAAEVSTELQVLLDSTTEDIEHTENQLVFLHTQKALEAWKADKEAQPEDCNHPNVFSLLVISDIVGMSALKQEQDTSVITRIHEKYIGHESTEGQREKCAICSANVTFTNVIQDVCTNGHQWKRCCLSLQLCQLRQTRRCQYCDCISLKPDNNKDCRWMLRLLDNRCIFCDGPLIGY